MLQLVNVQTSAVYVEISGREETWNCMKKETSKAAEYFKIDRLAVIIFAFKY
jgi:hypothetical protein